MSHTTNKEEEEVVSVFPPLSNESIREAVRSWRHDQAQATEKYNHINKWNTSQVTNMKELFINYKIFNENISEWDVSNVTNMSHMFHRASSFNQVLNKWNVSKVTNMSCMFFGSSSFNQEVSGWDVSNVTNMSCLFYGASSFNQDLSRWDVSNVTNMSSMFYYASSFNQDVSGWDVSNVTSMSCMFYGALSFDQDVSSWDVGNLHYMIDMFTKSKVGHKISCCLCVNSFFEGKFRDMNRTERQQVFAVAFAWRRRKDFLIFLVKQGYLHSSCTPSINSISAHEEYGNIQEVTPCDVIFDVEDLFRTICNYL